MGATVDLVLDYDGVISPLGVVAAELHTMTARGVWWSDPVEFRCGYTMYYSPTLIARINAIALNPDVRCLWLTSWGADAASELSPAMGLDGTEWEVLEMRWADQDSPSDYGKVHRMRHHLAATEADVVVWCDDDIGTLDQPGAADPAVLAAVLLDPRLYVIRPDSRRGLVEREITLIERVVDTATNT